MKVLLHGATNWGSSNFGDYLYVDVVSRRIHELHPGAVVQVHQPSPFFREHLPDAAPQGVTVRNADLLVYVPGGYFGEGNNARFRDTAIQFVRFMPVGLVRAALRKPMVAVGVGAGPLRTRLMRTAVRRITSAASLVVVRDPISRQALEDLGIQGVKEGADMLLSVDLRELAETTDQVQALVDVAAGRKILFVHYNHSTEAAAQFTEAVRAFTAEHPDEYCVIVGSDQVLAAEAGLFEGFRDGLGTECHLYHYSSPSELIALLDRADLVLTTKLHVGVASGMLGKSVVCSASHPEKTTRFYAQMGQADRCRSLYATTSAEVAAMLGRHARSTFTVPAEERERALVGWRGLEATLKELDAGAR